MSDKILYGKDNTEGVVGLHPFGDNSFRLYYQDGTEEERDFYPFLHAKWNVAENLSKYFHLEANVELEGNLPYRNLVCCTGMDQFYDVKSWLRENYESEDYYLENSPTVQFLQQSGFTLYGGMEMEDLHRMQIDIEVRSSRDSFPKSKRREDEIIIISLSNNNGWTEVLHTSNVGTGFSCSSEKDLLNQFLRVIHRKDPDVLEFHNGLGFDLPYLRDRFQFYDIPFAIGRDNSTPKSWESTKSFAEREVRYENFVVNGRSIIDSYFLAADYDTYARDLPSYGLKDLSKHFGFSRENREYVEGDQITRVWERDPERLLKYALDDVIETKKLVQQLGNASFALTKIVPMTWQENVIAGTATTLESVMVREYLRKRHSLPDGSEPKNFAGGYTKVFWRGVFEDLAYEDVSSLYPSIMLKYDVKPDTDPLDIFQHILDKLTTLRLKNKQLLNELEGSEKEKVDAEQAAQKIIINSAYGMLGFPFAIFSDMEKAEFVTKRGRELLKKMILITEDKGARVVSSDTDGALFEVPSDTTASEFISEVDNRMPEGIEIDKDYEAEAAMIYKAKNYAKLIDGKIEISGASLMGRQKEPFFRQYIRDQIENLLRKDVKALHDTHEEYKAKLLNRSVDIENLCRRQRLKKSIEEYERGVEENENKHRLAQYEAAQRKDKPPKKGDVIKYYIKRNDVSDSRRNFRDARLLREYDNDENIEYYLKRLNTTSELFHGFVSNPNEVFDKSPSTQNTLFGNTVDFSGMEIKETKLNKLPELS